MDQEATSSGLIEKVTETWVSSTERPVSLSSRNACMVHIYPTGPTMGTRYTVGDAPIVIGRASDCDIRCHGMEEAIPSGERMARNCFISHRPRR